MRWTDGYEKIVRRNNHSAISLVESVFRWYTVKNYLIWQVEKRQYIHLKCFIRETGERIINHECFSAATVRLAFYR